jgi:hypothetical protein
VRQSEAPRWEEDVGIQPEMRWLEIPEVLLNTDIDTMLTIPAVTFVGVVDVKHQCRPATHGELRDAQTDSLIKADSVHVWKAKIFRVHGGSDGSLTACTSSSA